MFPYFRTIVGLGLLLLVLPWTHGIVALSYSQLPTSPLSVAAFMTATFLAIVAELKPTRLRIGTEVTEVTLSTALGLPLLLLYGWPFALLLLTFAVTTADIQIGKPWYKVLYNAGNYSFSVWAAGQVYALVSSASATLEQTLASLPAGLVSGATFSLVNTLLVVFPVAVAQGTPYRAVLLPYLRAAAPYFGGLTSL